MTLFVKTTTALAPSSPSWRARLGAWTPFLAIAPSLVASFVYVFVFCGWTLYISMSDSSLLPTYRFIGLRPYFELWANARWKTRSWR